MLEAIEESPIVPNRRQYTIKGANNALKVLQSKRRKCLIGTGSMSVPYMH